MNHLENRQMMEMLAGQVPPEQYDAGLRHIAACSRCRSHWQDLQATWGDLGQWEFQGSGDDFTASILAKASQQSTLEPPPVRFFRLSSIVRIAASVLIGLFVGHLAGRLPSAAGTAPSEQEIVQTLHLETLSLASSTGFGEPLLESLTATDGIEP